MPILETLEQRALFRLTRLLTFFIIVLLSIGLLIGIAFFASDFLPNGQTHVAYSTISGELHPATAAGSESNSTTPPSRSNDATPEIPFVLQPYFSNSDNRQVLLGHLAGLDSDERRDYLDNLAEVVATAKEQGGDVVAVVNRYFEDKSSQMDLAKADKTARLLRQVYVIGGCISTLMLIALASLILVLLAIERNTRAGGPPIT